MWGDWEMYSYPGIMYEGATPRVGGLLACRRIVEGLDDCLYESESVYDLERVEIHTVLPEPLYPTMRVKGVLN